MKKTMNFIGAILFVSTIFTSCGGNSIESDAKKVADLLCKTQKLTEKATSGDASVIEESTKLTNEAQTLQKQLEEKYTSDSDKKKLAEALIKEMGNCK